MPITVTLAREIVRAGKDDARLLAVLAGELVKSVDRAALARYLLSDEVAHDLLAQRLAAQPERTLSDLERLAKNGSVRAAAPTVRASAAAAPQVKVRVGKGKRHRLAASEVDHYKRAILAFLGNTPGANRKAITESVGLPTPSIYNRLINELKTAGLIRSQGQKAKTVYSLTAGATRAPRKAPGRKKAKNGRRKKA